MMDLAHPWLLLLLPLPVLVHFVAPPYRQRDSAVRLPFFRQMSDAAGLEPKEGAAVVVRRRLVTLGAAVIWILVVAALCGPARLGPPQNISKANRDVVLAIDISGSMDTVDFPDAEGARQQRFAAVQGVVDDFVTRRDGDRVALIVFGSKAYVQAPLTQDLQTVNALLAQTEVGMAGPHTALGDAIGLAIHTFEASEIEQRMLIVLSDGNDTASQMSPINAAEIANDKGVQIFGVGVGDKDASGENRLDMGVLESLASRTGGQAYFAGDAGALQSIYDEIDALTPRDVEALSWRQREDLSYIPLSLAALIGLALLMLVQMIPVRRTQS